MADATLGDTRSASGPMSRLLNAPAARRFRRNRGAVIGLALVALLVVVAVLAPVLAPYAPDAQDLRARLRPPGRAHLFGTDEFGRDILSRVLYGARISLFTGLVPVISGLVVGTSLGLLAGFYRGWVDGVSALSAEDLERPIGKGEGPWAEHSYADLVLHIHREVIHHGAEILLLRNLYRHRAA